MDIELCPTWSNSKFRCSSERRELIYIAFVFFIHTKSAERLREDLGYYPKDCKEHKCRLSRRKQETLVQVNSNSEAGPS